MQLAPPDTRRLDRWLWLAAQSLLAGAAAWLCWPATHAFLRMTIGRLAEPCALWWLEPLFFRAALAAHHGTPLYGPPSLDYTPGIYNPGLAVAGGLLLSVFGDELTVVRTFSFTCLLALATLIAWWSAREAKSPAVGIVAFSLVLSTVTSMGTPLTVTNVDVPCVLFCVLACFLVAREQTDSIAATVAAAFCVVIAFAFKQPGCLIAAPIALHLLTQRPKRALLFVAVTAGLAGAMVGALLLASSGWYWTYAVKIPLHTERVPQPQLLATLLKEHRLATRAAQGMPLLLMVLGPKHTRWLWLPLAATFTLMAYLGVSKAGGGSNTLLPFYVGGVLLFVMLPQLTQVWRGRRAAQVIELLLVAAVIGVGATFSNAKLEEFCRLEAGLVRASVHGRPERKLLAPIHAFEARLRQRIQRLPKPVFVGARFFGAGWPMNTHQTPLYEGSVRTAFFDVPKSLDPVLSSHHYASMVVWDYPHDIGFKERLKRYYEPKGTIGTDPLVGLRVRIWKPRRAHR